VEVTLLSPDEMARALSTNEVGCMDERTLEEMDDTIHVVKLDRTSQS